MDAATDIKDVMRKKNNVNSLGGAMELASDPETKARLEKNQLMLQMNWNFEMIKKCEHEHNKKW